jgi:hypothetical protein
MTKKEQAAMDALRDELALVRALRFTEADGPDVAIPEGHEGLRVAAGVCVRGVGADW